VNDVSGHGLVRVPFPDPRRVTIGTPVYGLAHATVVTGGEGMTDAHRAVLNRLEKESVSIRLVKIHRDKLSFVIDADAVAPAKKALQELGYDYTIQEGMATVSVEALEMWERWGIMSHIAECLLNAGVQVYHTGDSHDSVVCLIRESDVERALESLSVIAQGEQEPPAKCDIKPWLRHKIKVLKFGGTSVDTPEKRKIAANKVIAAREEGYRPVVVVSAMGRGPRGDKPGDPYATDTLKEVLMQVDPDIRPEPREMDLMMACGEIISTAVMAHTLKSMGRTAVALTGGQAGIVTTCEFGNAAITYIEPQRLAELVEKDVIPVVCGFQGVSEAGDSWDRSHGHGPVPHGEITTLGRGGSDTTAAALGAALSRVTTEPVIVEIYTDVDGVMTADPRDLAEGQKPYKLDVVTYEEISEMAHLGAKVVHPRAVRIAMEFGVPLWVKSTTSDNPGTRAVKADERRAQERPWMMGVARTANVVWVEFAFDDPAVKERGALEIYRLLGEAGINLYLITSGENSIGFAIKHEKLATARDVLSGRVIPVGSGQNCEAVYVVGLDEGSPGYQAQLRALQRIWDKTRIHVVHGRLVHNCGMVSVIAQNTREVSGLMARMMRCLSEAGIRVLQTADSEYSISTLIHEEAEDTGRRAVQALHKEFEKEFQRNLQAV
jgi:aspartate kinase